MDKALMRGRFREHVIEIRTSRPYFYAVIALFPDNHLLVCGYASRPDLAEKRWRNESSMYLSLLKKDGYSSYWRGDKRIRFNGQLPEVHTIAMFVVPE